MGGGPANTAAASIGDSCFVGNGGCLVDMGSGSGVCVASGLATVGSGVASGSVVVPFIGLVVACGGPL